MDSFVHEYNHFTDIHTASAKQPITSGLRLRRNILFSAMVNTVPPVMTTKSCPVIPHANIIGQQIFKQGTP
jgi:hypothetical protein